jgi:ferrochelatase
MRPSKRIAVVLFNLGGPDSLAAVEPFLFNLFNDPAIVGLPTVLRLPLAWLLARRRARTARDIYARIGGASPLLANTEAQAAALLRQLADLGQIRVFLCMRYWHPMSDAAAAAVRSYAPDCVVLLPLYPQFSSTTTASSWTAWRKAALAVGLAVPEKLVCCYPTADGFVAAAAELVQKGIVEAKSRTGSRLRVLFSAHGLPKKVIARGDPYASEVQRSARTIAERLGLAAGDWTVCFQSRVGPLEWIGPSTDDEIRRAGRDGVGIVLFPIAFVCEHSETLVELDMDYRKLAEQCGVRCYVRVPTVGTHARFIEALADLARAAANARAAVRSEAGVRICAPGDRCCPNPAI